MDHLEVMDLLHILLDTMTDFDGPVVNFVEKEVNEIEELVYLCDTKEEITDILQVRLFAFLFVSLKRVATAYWSAQATNCEI
jgi:Mg2+ and Co2+ transporter CorA